MTAPVALVAGGSRGLGLLICRDLLARGFTVIACARSGSELADAETLARTHARATTRAMGLVNRVLPDGTDSTTIQGLETEHVVGLGRYLEELVGPALHVALTHAKRQALSNSVIIGSGSAISPYTPLIETVPP